MNSFLTGLSLSGGCIAHCGTALLPILLCQAGNRCRLALVFLGFRYLGYLGFAILGYAIGNHLISALRDPLWVKVAIPLAITILLFRYSWIQKKQLNCAAEGGCSGKAPSADFHRFKKNRWQYAAGAGLLTGLSFCGPFISILLEVAASKTIWLAVGSFSSFYLGTSVALLPLLCLGMLGKSRVLQQIGFLSGMLASGSYFLQSLFVLMGGSHG